MACVAKRKRELLDRLDPAMTHPFGAKRVGP